jgi:rhomboid-like protein
MSAYRQSPFDNLTPVVKNLLIINLICFIPYIVLSSARYDSLVVSNVGLFYFNSPLFRPWQVITYMFFHGGWTHILFNMFALFSFGPIVEYAIGPKRFLNLFFICGIGAAIIQMLVQGFEVHSVTDGFTLLRPITDQSFLQYGPQAVKLYGIFNSPTIGASGAIFGLLVAFVMLYPDMELMMLFIPVPIKAKYLVPVYVLIEIYSGLSPTAGDNVAHFAHIGGAIFGFLMIKIWRYR